MAPDGSRGTRLVDPHPATGEAPPGMRHCTVLAMSALAGCLVLVGGVATLSVAWSFHPALTLVAAVPLAWAVARLVGWVFTADAPQR